MHSNLLLAFRQLIKFYSTSQLVLLFFKDSEHIKLFSAPKHCMGNYCTVIYLLEWSLNQAEGGLMSQTFRVTLPIVAERKLHRGVILFVLKVQLGSDSASARLICVKAGHHIQSTPLIDAPFAVVDHTEAIWVWFMAASQMRLCLQRLLVIDQKWWRCGEFWEEKSLSYETLRCSNNATSTSYCNYRLCLL